MEKLFPEEVIASSAEKLMFRQQPAGHVIYLFIIVILCVSLFVAAFIPVDVSITCRGELITEEAPHRVVSMTDGVVLECNMARDLKVRCGDTLLVLDYRTTASEIREVETILMQKQLQVVDIGTLLAGDGALHTKRYINEREGYFHRMKQKKNELAFLKDEYESMEPLFREGFIARLEFEKYKNRYLDAAESVELLTREYRKRWQQELSVLHTDVSNLRSRLLQLEERMDLHFILAPMDGTLADYAEILSGSYLGRGALLGRIIPHQELIASCMITPDQISKITPGQQVRLSVDAFPSSAWGRLTGSVSSVPSDVTVQSGRAFYPVTCNLDSDFAASGKIPRSELMSGMTFTGLFLLERKTLLRLLSERKSQFLIQTREA